MTELKRSIIQKQDVFVKHYAHSGNKVWKERYFNHKCHSQGHTFIDLYVN